MTQPCQQSPLGSALAPPGPEPPLSVPVTHNAVDQAGHQGASSTLVVASPGPQPHATASLPSLEVLTGDQQVLMPAVAHTTANSPTSWLPSPQHQDIVTSATNSFNTAEGLTPQLSYALTCIKIYQVVSQTGLPNYLGARIPLQHHFNMYTWRSQLQKFNYHDTELCDHLDFGFPIGVDRSET